jgi:methylenetetrahydrofolate reductase (NADPH)
VSVLRFRRRPVRLASSRAALVGALAEPTYELMPLPSGYAQSAFIPPGAWVSVTASPRRGLEATVDLAVHLEGRGYRAIPHLAARMVRDRTHLRELAGRLTDGGVDRAFVVAGDPADSGDYPDGLSLLRAMADMGIELSNVGVPCYPQGHAFISDETLLQALAAKEPFAHYMTTQLCFDADAISAWIGARRADGFRLPVQIGVAGAVEPHRLLAISARIGVRDSARFLVNNAGFVGRLVRSGGFYRPDRLLDSLASLFADPISDVRWVHLYTFNQVAATESWRARFLADRLLAQPAQPA